MSYIYQTWWNTTITLYNKYEDPQTQVVRWFKHKIDGCFWSYTGNKVKINNVSLDTSSTICRIREDDKFLPKYDWEQLPNDVMGDYFTLGRGDIIIKGDISDDIDEYVSGHRSTDLLSKYGKYQECIEVGTIAINVGGGRNNPHYRVSDDSARAWEY